MNNEIMSRSNRNSKVNKIMSHSDDKIKCKADESNSNDAKKMNASGVDYEEKKMGSSGQRTLNGDCENTKKKENKVPNSNEDEEEPQLLILGSGLDRSYNFGVRTFHVDFDEVVEEICREAEEASETDNKESRQFFIGADLRQPHQLLEKLKLHLMFSTTAITVVLAESVLSYLEEKVVRQLLKLLQEQLRCFVVIYDPLLEKSQSGRFVALSQSMNNTFASRNVPIQTALGSVDATRKFLHSCSYENAFSMTMLQFLEICNMEEKEAIYKKMGIDISSIDNEPFDEFASLAALHNLYAISCASNIGWMFDQFVVNIFRPLPTAKYQPFISQYKSLKSNLSLKLRAATSIDSTAIETVFVSSHEPFIQLSESVRKHIRKLKQQIFESLEGCHEPSNERCFYVMENLESREVVGCACITINPLGATNSKSSQVAHLTHLSVDSNYRGQGIGGHLLDQAIHHAQNLQCERIELTTLGDMRDARRLYASRGFMERNITLIGKSCQLVHISLSL